MDSHRPSSRTAQEPRRPKIAFVGQPEYFRFAFETDLDELAEIAEFRLGMELVPDDYRGLVDFDADINIFFRGEFMPDEVLHELQGQRVALSSEPFPRLVDGRWQYTRDSLVRYLEFRQIRHKPFDLLFHYDAASLPLLERDGLSPAGEFAMPVATQVYAPRYLPERWNLFFIGRSTPHREAFFGPLKHVYEFLHISHGIYGPSLVEYICSSTISLNVHAEEEVSWEPRMQMLMSCGAFVISEPITPNPYLRPGTDFIVASSPAEMRETVEHYLRHDGERRVIAEAGRQRVLEVLDARRSFAGLVDSVQSDSIQSFVPGSPWGVMDTASRCRDSWSRIKRALG